MVLLFWICTILLIIGAIAGPYARSRGPYWDLGYPVLVVIDIVLLGWRVFGMPH